MKNKKLNLYEEKEFTEADLDDALQGLLRLSLVNSPQSHAQPRSPSITSLHKHTSDEDDDDTKAGYPSPQKSSARKFNRPKSKSLEPRSPVAHSKLTKRTSPAPPNRHNPKYRRAPTFVATSRYARSQQQQQHEKALHGMKLLLEAAKKVEGVDTPFFKIDASDIERITASPLKSPSLEESQLTYNKTTGAIRAMSKNAIAAPIISAHDLLPTFEDLEDDFSLFSSISPDISQQRPLPWANVSSIAPKSSSRRSTLGGLSTLSALNRTNVSLLSSVSKEQQASARKEQRERSAASLKEMDKMWHDQSRLLAREHSQALTDDENLNTLNSSSLEICREFTDSNLGLSTVAETYQKNIDAGKTELANRRREREKQHRAENEMLARMQRKIDEAKRRDEEREQRRKHAQQQEMDAQRRREHERQQKEQREKDQKEKERRKAQEQKAQSEQKAAAQPPPPRPPQPPAPAANEPWFPGQIELSATHKRSKEIYAKCEQLETELPEAQQSEFESKIGIIMVSVAANEESIRAAWKRFQTFIDTKTSPNSRERMYCLWFMTNSVIEDSRIVKSSAQKFAAAYFLSFVMAQYKEQYAPIFDACFHHNAPFTVPYLSTSLRDLTLKDAAFDASKPSMVRCLALGYKQIKRLSNIPSEKRKHLQAFEGDQFVFEAESKYFTRMASRCGLYAAFMALENRREVNSAMYVWAEFRNPIGIGTGACWRWLARLVGLPRCVYPELCAILAGVGEIVGHDMLSRYPKQFPKILRFIYENVHAGSDTSTSCRDKARRELALFFRECGTPEKLQIKRPEESKLIGKTVGASTLQAEVESGSSRGRGRGRGRGGRGRGRGRWR